MKWSWKKSIMWLFLFVFFSLSGAFLLQNGDTLEQVEQIPLFITGYLAVIVIAGLFLNGIFLLRIARPFGIHIPYAFLLSCATSLVNMVTPLRGGAFFRAWYLNRTLGMKYKDFTISLFGNYLIVFLVSSLTALSLLFCTEIKKQEFILPLFFIFGALFLGCISILIFPKPISKHSLLSNKWNNIVKGWNCIRSSPLLIFQLILLSFGNLVLEAMGILCILSALNVPIHFLSALFLSAFLVVGIFINITPGSLGISESLVVFAGILLGINPQIMLLGTLIRRAIGIVVLLLLGIPAKLFLLHISTASEKQLI